MMLNHLFARNRKVALWYCHGRKRQCHWKEKEEQEDYSIKQQMTMLVKQIQNKASSASQRQKRRKRKELMHILRWRSFSICNSVCRSSSARTRRGVSPSVCMLRWHFRVAALLCVADVQQKDVWVSQSLARHTRHQFVPFLCLDEGKKWETLRNSGQQKESTEK